MYSDGNLPKPKSYLLSWPEGYSKQCSAIVHRSIYNIGSDSTMLMFKKGIIQG
jgi:hypothetical protein